MNIFVFMNYISADWDEKNLYVIRNCFQKGGFGVWVNLDQTDSSPLEDEDFQPLQNFLNYAKVDNNLTISTKTWGKVIVDVTTMENVKKEEDKLMLMPKICYLL